MRLLRLTLLFPLLLLWPLASFAGGGAHQPYVVKRVIPLWLFGPPGGGSGSGSAASPPPSTGEIPSAETPAPGAKGSGFSLASPVVANGGPIPLPQVFTSCGGENISPPLEWSGVPAGTRSFALTMFDQDARQGAGWWLWAVIDIPPWVRELKAGADSPGSPGLPPGARSLYGDFGAAHYDGPCPPLGDPSHHYVIVLWALDVARLGEQITAAGPELVAALRRDSLARAALIGRYGR